MISKLLSLFSFKRCTFFHKWAKWEIVEKGNITTINHTAKTTDKTGFFEVQRRECDRCGLVQFKTHKAVVI
jgi:hypothetical protein